MRLLQDAAFEDVFRQMKQSAYHLEVEDSYHTPEESQPFQAFLEGTPDDFEWHRPWLDLVRQVTRAGKDIHRIRVVSIPHVDYTRWSLSVAPLNIEAGEDIRWLPRQHLVGLEVTTDDFWLIDRNRVVFTVFDPNGKFSGGAETTDPAIVERCLRIWDKLWAIALPHAIYVAK